MDGERYEPIRIFTHYESEYGAAPKSPTLHKAPAMTRPSFSGFPVDLLHFLDELTRHNNRQWFQANKPRYEREVLEPALAFVEAMAKPIEKISPHFQAVPKRMGGSLMRVYRDVRFSKDKRPYKTNVGIQFRHEAGRDVHAPGFYFHIEPDEVFLGVGIWHPDSASLGKIRAFIDANVTRWKRLHRAKAFRGHYQLAGDCLKRPPKGYPADHPLIDDLKRKDHIATCPVEHNVLMEPSIVTDSARAFRAGRAYMRFLCDALDLPF